MYRAPHLELYHLLHPPLARGEPREGLHIPFYAPSLFSRAAETPKTNSLEPVSLRTC